MALSLVSRPAEQDPPHPHAIAAFNEAVRTPERLALGYFDRALSYGELAAMAAGAARAFTEAGLQRGERLIIQLQNVPQFVAALLGAWSLGVVVVPVSPMYRVREVRKILGDSAAAAMLTSPTLWHAQGEGISAGSTLRAVFLTAMEDFTTGLPDRYSGSREAVETLPEIPGLDVTDLSAVMRQALAETTTAPTLAGPDPHEPALLAYTSGTTGPPKGAIVTHHNLIEEARGFCAVNEVLSPAEVHLCIAPLVHITGIGVSLMSWLLSGGAMVLSYRFHPEQAMQDIESWSVTWTSGAATAFISLLTAAEESRCSTVSFRHATAGGAPVPTAVLRRFRARFGIELRPGYGMTETSGSISSTPLDRPPRSDPETGIPSAGFIHPGVELAIMGPDDHLLERGDRGELCLRGPAIISGYWGQDEATASTFRNGWLHTGDVGFMDEEGWFYLVDRTKNMINASGYKVWPREVEEVISQVDDIVEVAVVGVPHEYRGETVKAFVVRRTGSSVSAADLLSHCRAELAAYKVPSEIVFMNDLPKNPNGKILHRDLRTMSNPSATA